MDKKKRCNVTLMPETQERLLQFGYEHHIPGGLSGALEYIAWNSIKVKNEQVRGQISLEAPSKAGSKAKSANSKGQ